MTAEHWTTENWIALFAVYTVALAALALTLRHRARQQEHRYRDLETAYRQQEREVSDRTQSLRAINSALYQEIEQREHGEQQLRTTRAYLNNIIDSMPSVIIGVTSDGRITHWNTRAVTETGRGSDAIGHYLWDVYPALPVDLPAIRQTIATQVPSMREACRLVVHGETRYLDIAVYPLHGKPSTEHPEAIIQSSDVTLRVIMERTLVQNEKLLSLGELAAGVAHEINNPLGAILQHVQNIERRTSSALAQNRLAAEQAGTSMDSIAHYLEQRQIGKLLGGIREAGERSTRLVASLLDFSYPSQPQAPADLNALIRHCLELSGNLLSLQPGQDGPRVDIALDLDPQLPEVVCSAGEIQQVLFNLLRNACQSFGAERAGAHGVNAPRVGISTHRDAADAVIRVEDNGPGMEESVRQRVFEAFFTTKPVGQGTGLGLSISHLIITERHRGRINVESAPGRGTCFTIRLPLPPASAPQPTPQVT